MADPTPMSLQFPMPFVPRDFYYLPQTWLNQVITPAQLDTYDLLFRALDAWDGLITLAAEEVKSLTREPPPGRPSLISHVTFGQELHKLLAADRLRLTSKPGTYAVTDGTAFAGSGLVYRPNSYCDNRWPHFFGKNAWGPRAALLALLVALHDRYVQLPGPYDAPLTVSATVPELRELCRHTLPSANADKKVGEGLNRLTGLSVVDAPRAASR